MGLEYNFFVSYCLRVDSGILIETNFKFTLIQSASLGLATMLGGGMIQFTAEGMTIAGWRVNPRGTSLAHFIGSPKMSMPNVFAKPKIMLPIICNAACMGILAALFQIQGTPVSAGFGFSGLVGPLNHLNIIGYSVWNIIVTILVFAVAPVAFGILFNYLFTRIWKVISPENYRLDIA